MKKIILSIIILFGIFTSLVGQTKLVLVEQFSNVGCGPCAKFSPYLDSLLMVRQGEVVSIRYHVNWPSEDDPFYLNEKAAQDKRIAYYKITGVPSIIVDGEIIPATISTVSEKVDAEMKTESAFKLNIASATENNKLNLKVGVTPLNNMQSEKIRLFIAVVEEEINLDKPSLNGEKHYYNILRKMLPGGDGYAFSGDFMQNEEKSFETSWDIQGFLDMKQLGIIAFMQNIENGKIYNVLYAPSSTDKADVGKIVLVQNLPDKICSPHFQPEIKFRNIGKNAITQATINISINGSLQQTSWQGNLEYLENVVASTPDFTDYTLTEGNEMNKAEIWLSDINGTEGSSEKYTVTFSNSLMITNSAKLTIFTDKKPEETTWKLFNSAGNIVDEGGPYESPRKFYEKMLNIQNDDCYTVHFYDSGKDGIVSNLNGNGYYKIEQITVEGKKSLALQGDYNTEEHTVNFKMRDADPSSIAQTQQSLPVFIYDEKTNELCINKTGKEYRILLYTSSGQTILDKKTTHNTISLKTVEKGIYLLQINIGNESFTRQLVIK